MSSASQKAAVETISRREAARFLLSAAASGFALPAAFAADDSVWHHIAHGALHGSDESQLGAANWKPVFLTAAQEESLRALAEVILPGSTKALVSRFIDLLLSVEREAAQKKFAGSLEAIEQESVAKFGKPFVKLSAQDQNALVAAMSSDQGSGDQGSGDQGSGDQASRMRGHFDDLKEWINGAYYSSEIGMRELGWTPDRVFATFPSCQHAEGHS